ncbi:MULTISPECIES: endonuclease/exonuclease/phosphatase family protein [unclassified Streptomyces]|uniref:endonuclease/exonuclease/phosphatase family protein n=1 Tax=unclassified Streptomyces TaxID=2593676 RepID=UPI0033B328CE
MPRRPGILTKVSAAALRSRTPWLTLVAAALVALVVVTLSGRPGATHAHLSDAVPGELRIATWNMCDVRQWNCQDTGSSRQKLQALKRLAAVDGAQVIMLQEVCAGDLASARKELGNGWRSTFLAYAYRDARRRQTEVRCADQRQGQAGFAILASSPLSRVSVVPSRQPAVGLRRGILCATVASHRVQVCNAHLTLPGGDRAHPDWEYRDDQLSSLVGAVDARTVFGGDLNSAPPSAGNQDSWIWPYDMYRRYRECDQGSASSRSGRATHLTGHKVDYLFTALPRTHCSVRATAASDHLALVMGVRAG